MKQLEFKGIVAASGEVVVPAKITVVQDYALPRGKEYSVSVEFDDRVFRGEGADAFWAFARARGEFESLGWRVAVQGASAYCFPSGMQGEAGALYLYRHPKSPQDDPLEAVETFAGADLDEVVTLAEQKSAHRARMEARDRTRRR